MASSKIAVRLPRLSLLGKFALVSLIPIVVLGLVLAKTIQVQIRNQALTSARQLAALVARLDIQPQLKPDDLSQGLTQERLQRLDEALHAGLVGEEIARVKIWSRDLHVVYSDDRELIGRAFPSSDELEEALDGHVASEVSDLTKEENVGQKLRRTPRGLRPPEVPGRTDAGGRVRTLPSLPTDRGRRCA